MTCATSAGWHGCCYSYVQRLHGRSLIKLHGVLRFMKTMQKGFTLIELMIVVAIIGILAAIAIPAYQNYTIRAQVTEGISLADSYKTAVAEFYQNVGTFPVDATVTGSATEISMPGLTTGKYVSAIIVLNGVVTVTYSGAQVNKNLKGDVLTIQPGIDTNNDVIWVCGTAANPGVTLSGKAATTVPNQYLPSSCHP